MQHVSDEWETDIASRIIRALQKVYMVRPECSGTRSGKIIKILIKNFSINQVKQLDPVLNISI